MSARFSLGIQNVNNTINQAALEILAGSKGCRLVSIRAETTTAAAFFVYSIGRPAVAGITPAGLTQFPSVDDPTVLSLARVATSWGTSPTAPTSKAGFLTLPPTNGFSLYALFNRSIQIAANTTFVIFNATAALATSFTLEIDE